MKKSFSKLNDIKVLLITSSLAFLSPSCKTVKDADTARMNRVEFSQTKSSEIAKQACASARNKTAQNLCFLSEYGKQLLSQSSDPDDVSNDVKEKLERSGVKNYRPMSSYIIRPKTGGVCFSEDGYAVEAENFWNNQVEPLRKQIEHVAEFLAQYHVDVLGQDPGPFGIQYVELCPITVTNKRRMALHGTTLTIGLPVKGMISQTYGWYTFTELRQMWDQGEIFSENYSIKDTVVNLFIGKRTPFLWLITNPVGPVRNNLRSFLRVQGQDLVRKLESINRPKDNIAKNQIPITIKSTMSLNRGSNEYNSRYMKDVIDLAYEHLDRIIQSPQVFEFLDEWLCQAQLVSTSPDLANAAIGGFTQRNESTTVNYDIKSSLVAVANFHNINIDVMGAFISHSRFIETPRSNNQTFKFDVKAEGKVVVVTGDQVNVTTALSIIKPSVERSVYTKSLYKAIYNVSQISDKNRWCSKPK
jgi:hypothetical protein